MPVVLTDACFRAGVEQGLGVFLWCPKRKRSYYTYAPAPDWMMNLFRSLKEKKTYIGQLELVAAVMAYLTFPDILAGELCHHFIDNQGAYYSLLSGYSDKADCALVIHQYHLQTSQTEMLPVAWVRLFWG